MFAHTYTVWRTSASLSNQSASPVVVVGRENMLKGDVSLGQAPLALFGDGVVEVRFARRRRLHPNPTCH